MNQPIKLILVLSTALVAGATLGCATGKQDSWTFARSLDPRNMIGGKQEELAPPQTPTRLVSTWQDASLNRVGQKSQRGFGGRLLFFNSDSEEPIRVVGQLVVYAYDETDRAEHESHPTRRYVFPAEQFAKHESVCQLGPSYSVWLPWDEIGGEQKNISLIARFEPEGAALIAGEQTRHLLPGKRQLATGETAPPVEQVGEIQLTEFTQKSQIAAPAGAASGTKPVSIKLSQERWKQRLAKAQAAMQEKSTESPSND